MADFARGAATWQTGRNKRVSLILAHSLHCAKTYDVIHKTGNYIIFIILPSEEGRARATGNMYKNLVKFGHMVFEICEQTDRQTGIQTEKHTDTLIAILRTPLRAK